MRRRLVVNVTQRVLMLVQAAGSAGQGLRGKDLVLQMARGQLVEDVDGIFYGGRLWKDICRSTFRPSPTNPRRRSCADGRRSGRGEGQVAGTGSGRSAGRTGRPGKVWRRAVFGGRGGGVAPGGGFLVGVKVLPVNQRRGRGRRGTAAGSGGRVLGVEMLEKVKNLGKPHTHKKKW